MKRMLLVVAGAAALGVAASPGQPVAPPTVTGVPTPSATAVVTPPRPGVRAALTLKLRYEMICGRPGRGPLVVTLPRAMHVPRTIARTAVTLQGKPPRSVAVAGHLVTVGIPLPKGVSCDSITMGTLTTTIGRAARLGNPHSPGIYLVRARIDRHAFTAKLSIDP